MFVLCNIQYLVSRAGLPAPDNVLDALPLAESGLRDHLVLIMLPQVLTSEWAEAKSRMAKVCHLEESVCTAKEDSEALRVAHAHVHELMAERVSLTAGTKQAKAECGTSGARI